MAKVQLLQRLRLVPAPAPDSLPRPSPKPISSVQDADTRILSFPRGPAPGSRLSPEFVREIGRFAYLWGWPLVNVFNRYTSFKRLWRPLLIGGIAPVREEWKWVDPATFFDVLTEALDAARPLPGEEALYALIRSVLDAARRRPTPCSIKHRADQRIERLFAGKRASRVERLSQHVEEGGGVHPLPFLLTVTRPPMQQRTPEPLERRCVGS